MVISGLILDFDGLIVDTEVCDMRAWMEEAARAGVSMTEARFAQVWDAWAWHRTTPVIGYLAERAPYPFDVAEVARRRLARYTELCAGLPVRPGIGEWIVQASELGMRLVVATNDNTGRARQHLDRLGLADRFTAVVTLQDGMARKPAPDVYLRALDVLGLNAARTVAVEDSGHGVRAAHRAGTRVIAYPTALSALTDLSEADLVVTDVATMPLAEALDRLRPETPSAPADDGRRAIRRPGRRTSAAPVSKPTPGSPQRRGAHAKPR